MLQSLTSFTDFEQLPLPDRGAAYIDHINVEGILSHDGAHPEKPDLQSEDPADNNLWSTRAFKYSTIDTPEIRQAESIFRTVLSPELCVDKLQETVRQIREGIKDPERVRYYNISPSSLQMLMELYRRSISLGDLHAEGKQALHRWLQDLRSKSTGECGDSAIGYEESLERLQLIHEAALYFFSRIPEMGWIAFFGGFVKGKRHTTDLDIVTCSEGSGVLVSEGKYASIKYLETHPEDKAYLPFIPKLHPHEQESFHKLFAANQAPPANAWLWIQLACEIQRFQQENPVFLNVASRINANMQEHPEYYSRPSKDPYSSEFVRHTRFRLGIEKIPFDSGESPGIRLLNGPVFVFTKGQGYDPESLEPLKLFYNSELPLLWNREDSVNVSKAMAEAGL